MKYRVADYLPPVEIPEVDAFLTDLRALYERHGIGINPATGAIERAQDIDFAWFSDQRASSGQAPLIDDARRRARDAGEKADMEKAARLAELDKGDDSGVCYSCQ